MPASVALPLSRRLRTRDVTSDLITALDTERRIVRSWRSTAKQVDTVRVTWDRIETSESIRVPRSRTTVDGTTKPAPTRSGVRGS